VNFDQLARVIECDPGLTANVLQLANSAYFGWQGGIGSVRDAISRLGTRRIFQMVLCMSVAPLVRRPIRGYDLSADQLWEHSVAVAICAEKLAAGRRPSCQPHAFTAGLLHDLGKVLLGTFVEVDDRTDQGTGRSGPSDLQRGRAHGPRHRPRRGRAPTCWSGGTCRRRSRRRPAGTTSRIGRGRSAGHGRSGARQRT
jgi:hypothetical protein